jgi:type II secretory pathway pseudopilin PulG
MGLSHQRGISLIEALIMLAVTSLAIATVLPLLGRGIAGDLRLANASLSASEFDQGEETFRTLLRGAAPSPTGAGTDLWISGDRTAVAFHTFVVAPTLCTGQGGWAQVRLWVEPSEEGGALRCQSANRQAVLARWAGAASGFSFRSNGSDWVDDLPAPALMRRVAAMKRSDREPESEAEASIFIRFSVQSAQGGELVWIAHAQRTRPQMGVREGREMDGGGTLDR